MPILVLETSGWKGQVALADDRQILHSESLSADRKHARELVPVIEAVLRAGSTSPRDLELILVNIGPGSYTGLRVGIMCATTLAYVNKCPILGVDSLAALAAMSPAEHQTICTAVDAQQGMVYAGMFQRETEAAVPLRAGETEILNAAEWSDRLPVNAYVTGPAVDRFSSVIPSHCIVADENSRHPTAQGVWQVGLMQYLSGKRDDLWKLEPLYLRSSSAEIKWEHRRRSAE